MARPPKYATPPLSYSTYRVSVGAIEAYIKQFVQYGNKQIARVAVARVLFEDPQDPLRDYWRAVREGRQYPLSAADAVELLSTVTDSPIAEPEKLLAGWAPAPNVRMKLTPRSAEFGEIEVTAEASETLIDPARFEIVSRYAAVYVDEVRFFQKRKDGPPAIGNGQYLRIEIPSGLHGAVVLPVDVDRGDVLLVTQYRHAPQRFMTECPRGFGHIGADQTAIDTARRELLQETGRVPVSTANGVEELYLLKDSYTDTGKLWEKPSFFLTYVKREPFGHYINELNPAMEDPVWVRLPRFIDALYSTAPIRLEPSEFEFALPSRHLDRMRPRTPISEGSLAVEDGFTLQTGLLAIPHLVRRFGRAILGNVFA